MTQQTNRPIYDNHLDLWQATVETHTGQLQRCLPSLEKEYKARRDAAKQVLEAIGVYKALCERVPNQPGVVTATDGGDAGSGANLQARLVLDVSYVLNGEDSTEMINNLRRLAEAGIGNGMLTGESGAEVEAYDLKVTIQQPGSGQTE